jgi:hypothetical protein
LTGPSLDYKTHVLIGVRANGDMTVICHWSRVPPLREVQQRIDGSKQPFVKQPFVTFMLCTPTSILPAGGSDLLRGSAGGQCD